MVCHPPTPSLSADCLDSLLLFSSPQAMHLAAPITPYPILYQFLHFLILCLLSPKHKLLLRTGFKLRLSHSHHYRIIHIITLRGSVLICSHAVSEFMQDMIFLPLLLVAVWGPLFSTCLSLASSDSMVAFSEWLKLHNKNRLCQI